MRSKAGEGLGGICAAGIRKDHLRQEGKHLAPKIAGCVNGGQAVVSSNLSARLSS